MHTRLPLALRPLRVADEAPFKAAVADFLRSDGDWEFAFRFDPAGDFAGYVAEVNAWPRGVPNFVPSTYLVAVAGDTIVGRVSIRHELNDFLLRVGGHIGYMVLAGHRRRGYATEILRQSLGFCTGLGLDRVLLTCDDGNLGSQIVIERNGGVLENILPPGPDLKVPKRRYWIDVPRPPAESSRPAPHA